MTTKDEILIAALISGVAIGLCGVIISNLAVQQMRGVLNRNRGPKDQIRWHDAIQFVAQNVIDGYRAAYPDGPLYRKLVMGYYIAAIGGVLGIGSAFMF